MPTAVRKRRGRPPHTDDPPVFLGTTIPSSIDRMLRDMADRLERPRSEILADAIRAYARRFVTIKHK
jgi:hypothetical protein